MPTCRDMSELVTDYLERALPLRTRVDVRWHLFRCPACQRYYAQMRQTVRLLSGVRPRPPLRPRKPACWQVCVTRRSTDAVLTWPPGK